ncbi:MAG: aspartate/glutamate racemase family protein [Bacteriovoracaceae bacterium]|nr:aspartate/glutamate racemase family protein [Bacteriovoracaceae bacterium]
MSYIKTRIGVFDSGIGGFSILSEIVKRVPSIEIDYISDDAFSPYGEKSDREIIARCHELTELLISRGCSLIVVACNSATAVAIADLRHSYTQIAFVGVEPYINVLNHTELFPNIDKAAVITTSLTGESGKFRDLREKIDPEHRIEHFSMPELASIVEDIFESGLNTQNEKRLERELLPLQKLKLSHLILGCTHYPLISQLIEDKLKVSTIGPGPYVANRLHDLLGQRVGPFPQFFNFLCSSNMEWIVVGIDKLHFLRPNS